MTRGVEFGDFLRSKRAGLSPADAGVQPDGRARRVSGLRRDEVAKLAGVSTEYYIRLEQGRAGNVSAEVLGALARALRLDAAERQHLTDLSGRRPTRRAPSRPQQVRPGVLALLETLSAVPAFVVGRRTDLLATNRLADAVQYVPGPRRNLARFVLLDPAARSLYVDWPDIAAETVALLRLEAGRHPDDRRLADMVGEFTLRCPEFTGWWGDHRVIQRSYGVKRYRHPVAGELSFGYEALPVPGDPDQTLCVYGVQPGSPSQLALQLLSEPMFAQPSPARHPTITGSDCPRVIVDG
jgi:transcriptional regulator with XRE-family HTH domain